MLVYLVIKIHNLNVDFPLDYCIQCTKQATDTISHFVSRKSFIEGRNKWVRALTNSFQILDMLMNLQELFLNSYFNVVLHFYSFIVAFLQFTSNVHHLKLYCVLLNVSRNRIRPVNGYKDWLNCLLKIQLPYYRSQFNPLLRLRVTHECLRRHS